MSISTLNVQGLNVPLKRQLIFEYLNKKDIDIVSVTETKLAQKEDLRRSLLNQYYYVYTAATPEDLGLKRESAMGTALLIKPYLRHYIHNIESYRFLPTWKLENKNNIAIPTIRQNRNIP